MREGSVGGHGEGTRGEGKGLDGKGKNQGTYLDLIKYLRYIKD